MKYEQAVRELEEIVERMENDELDIDQLSEQLKRAKTLVKLCKDKLTKTDEEIKKLLSEDWFTEWRADFSLILHWILWIIKDKCLILHTDLTDLTDFDSFGVFTERQNENPRCLQRRKIREIREIRVGDKREEAGRMSKYPFRAMIWQCWMVSDELIPDGALGLLRTASCRCAFSCFRCEAGRATLSRRLLLLQWFRYRPGRCCHHQEYPFRYPSRYPGWYPGWHPGWCHHLTEQRPSSA